MSDPHPSRRGLLAAGTLAVPALLLAPGSARAAGTVTAVLESEVVILDLHATTAAITRSFGYQIFDTLCAQHSKGTIHPKMVEGHAGSNDGLECRFTLREGLTLHNGAPVTAADCMASLRRWAPCDSLERMLLTGMRKMRAEDTRQLSIAPTEPLPLMRGVLGLPNGPVPFIMPEYILPPGDAWITEIIGSGPFTFERSQSHIGDRMVLRRNAVFAADGAAGLPVGRQGGEARRAGAEDDAGRRDGRERALRRQYRLHALPALRLPRPAAPQPRGAADGAEGYRHVPGQLPPEPRERPLRRSGSAAGHVEVGGSEAGVGRHRHPGGVPAGELSVLLDVRHAVPEGGRVQGGALRHGGGEGGAGAAGGVGAIPRRRQRRGRDPAAEPLLHREQLLRLSRAELRRSDHNASAGPRARPGCRRAEECGGDPAGGLRVSAERDAGQFSRPAGYRARLKNLIPFSFPMFSRLEV